MVALLKKLAFALTILVLVVFGYQNSELLSEKTHFVLDLFVEGYQFKTPEFPLVLLYGVFFLLGMLVAGFHGVYERIARKAEVRKCNKRIRSLEKENADLQGRLAELRPVEVVEKVPPGQTETFPAENATPQPITTAPPPSEDELPTL